MVLGDVGHGVGFRLSNGEVGTVVRQDSDDFERFVVVTLHNRRRRSLDDRKRYQISPHLEVEIGKGCARCGKWISGARERQAIKCVGCV